MERTSPPLRTVARAFEVIELLWELNGATLAEVTRRMDLPKSTVHDYLRTLEMVGYITRIGETYQLSYRFLTTGGRLRNRSRFFQTARPVVRRLADETGEVASIGVEEDGECVILHAMRGEKSLELGIYPGLRVPLHAHATGKVLLAHLPEAYAEETIFSDGLAAVTDHTITDVNRMKRELSAIREQGYAADWDEQILGMGTVSVPIVIEDDLVGSISVSGPTGRVEDDDYRAELLKGVREAANTIMVGYQYGH
ncbi:MAG: IclR family transcriptional regulator [Halobacteriota archaeon]|uniref:IclR family transcriptional regulator n=1 Tax=Natronomonas sp. TaxID=2184060 RepID=UPI00397548C6